MSEEPIRPAPVVVRPDVAEHLRGLGVDPAAYVVSEPVEPDPAEVMRPRRNRAERRAFVRKVSAEVKRRKKAATEKAARANP